mmetsp:Transcript_13710/g.28956  ORF Transcript_13710/g.28956 Transcript_13710/m.28956 type:complete len:107 (+) Transcript_13710:249-569(+)
MDQTGHAPTRPPQLRNLLQNGPRPVPAHMPHRDPHPLLPPRSIALCTQRKRIVFQVDTGVEGAEIASGQIGEVAAERTMQSDHSRRDGGSVAFGEEGAVFKGGGVR